MDHIRFQAIARFPDVTFIWKYEEPEDEFGKGEAATAPNLILSKWMPQVDILGNASDRIFRQSAHFSASQPGRVHYSRRNGITT